MSWLVACPRTCMRWCCQSVSQPASVPTCLPLSPCPCLSAALSFAPCPPLPAHQPSRRPVCTCACILCTYLVLWPVPFYVPLCFRVRLLLVLGSQPMARRVACEPLAGLPHACPHPFAWACACCIIECAQACARLDPGPACTCKFHRATCTCERAHADASALTYSRIHMRTFK